MKIIVFAHVNSKRPRVEKDLLGNLHIYVSAPPLEGKANKAIREALAIYLKISRLQVTLVRGEKSKQKIFVINEQK